MLIKVKPYKRAHQSTLDINILSRPANSKTAGCVFESRLPCKAKNPGTSWRPQDFYLIFKRSPDISFP